MLKNCIFSFSILVFIFLSSCKKEDVSSGNPPVTPPANIEADVYVAGYSFNGKANVATLWKNGVATDLTDGTNGAVANSVFVKGTDVYVAITEVRANGVSVAKLWKNGVTTVLDAGVADDLGKTYAAANAVFVNENTVYIAGYRQMSIIEGNSPTPHVFRVATVWIDGSPRYVGNQGRNGLATSAAYCVHAKSKVSATNVSVCGVTSTIAEISTYDLPFFWGGQNTNSQNNLLESGKFGGIAYGCFINDNLFTYSVGHSYTDGKAKLWRENTQITDLADNATAYGVYAVGDTSVYSVGFQLVNGKSVAKLWKGFLPGSIRATNLSDGTKDATANAIQVIEGNEFIAGSERTSSGYFAAKYWKNGVAVSLTDGIKDAAAYSICVIKK